MIDDTDKRDIQKMINDAIAKVTRFSQRKIGDTPTDDNQLVPRGYTNFNGSVASRPIGSIAQTGQQYFASDIGFPIFFTTNKNWVNGAGSVVASN